MRNLRPLKKSFTLAEALLSAAILALTISSVLLVFIACGIMNESSRQITIAASHAQFIMEDIKSRDFNLLSADEDGEGGYQFDLDDGRLGLLLNENIDTEITKVDDKEELLRVNVTVNWNSRGGRERSYSLTTLIAEP